MSEKSQRYARRLDALERWAAHPDNVFALKREVAWLVEELREANKKPARAFKRGKELGKASLIHAIADHIRASDCTDHNDLADEICTRFIRNRGRSSDE